MSCHSRFRFTGIRLIVLLLCLNSPLNLFAQQPSQSSNQKPDVQKTAQTPPEQSQASSQDPDNVVRINTQLVQIDAVVTDGKGNHIENLTEGDFDLLVDGKKQTLTYFRLVKLPESKTPEPASGKDKTAKDSLPPAGMPTKSLAPEDVKRTIAFVVDDLGLSFQSTHFTREAIKKFVREQMQEGDLVGIIRTGRGAGALQQFTSDKRVLYAAIEKLNWNPFSRDMLPNFGNNDPNDQRSQESRDAEARFEDFRETVFSVGTLGALNFVVRGLRELPGRKMAILISDGFRLFGRERDNSQVLDNLRRLVDLANRSSVVVYSIDAKGLQTLMPDASTGGAPQPEDYARVSQDNFDSQEGLTYIARETGGLAFLNSNDLNFGIRKSLEDARSYYLLGFDPENETFDRKYHSIKLKVTRPGLRVRTRAGFIGVSDRERRQEQQLQPTGQEARNRQIVGALFSPFGARDLSLQMTSFFFNSEKQGSFVRSLYHIDAEGLTMKDDPKKPGGKVMTLEIVSFAFNELGAVLEQHGRSFTLDFDKEHLETLKRKGLVYSDDFLLKKPGAYQFRTVLRDPETGKLGSVGQFIQVPDLTKKRLALSGLLLAALVKEQPAQNAAATQSPEVNSSSAVRRFPRGGVMDYGAVIYNPKLDSSGKHNLTMQVEIYRDGKQVYQSTPRLVDAPSVNGRVECGGRLSLGPLVPGDYQLHLVIVDVSAKSKYARVEQWMDFGVR